ncbi:MAG: SUMF1/EgtB/PvdO family nonheme iron enzyme [Gammaproteobacteria bacterium]|nr:SUMF1/EgtB/PvdO family nonheme iron enzyme [Gammaproteobacteria bacterium]
MKLVHLSDLHLSADPEQRRNQDIVTRSLLDALRDLKVNGLALDVIVITGDIAFAGKAADYQIAEDFCQKLLQTTGVTREHLYLAPGNHDVNREAVDHGLRIMCEGFKRQDDINWLLRNERPKLTGKFSDFNRFAQRVTGTRRFDDDYHFVESLHLDGADIALCGLNSALFAGYDGDDDKKLALGLEQVDAALREMNRNAALSIGFFHHPFPCFHPQDADCQHRLKKELDLLLTGHLHQPDNLHAFDSAGQCLLISAGACFETRESHNSFNIVDIDLHSGQGRVQFFKYFSKYNTWGTNVDANPHENGIFSFKLDKKRDSFTNTVLSKNASNLPGELIKLDKKHDSFTDTVPSKNASNLPRALKEKKNEAIPDRGHLLNILAEHLKAGELALCIGPALSREAGAPDWKTVFKPLCNRDELFLAESDYPTLAGDLVKQKRKNIREIKGRIQHAIDACELALTPALEAIRDLPIKLLLTGNYDPVLEYLYERPKLRRITPQADYFDPDSAKITLVYLLGNAEDPQTMVVTDEELRRYPDTCPNLIRILRQTFQQRHLLFLGYNAADPVFKALLDHLNPGPHHYAVFDKAEQSDLLRYRQRYGLTAVSGVFSTFLEDLRAVFQGNPVVEPAEKNRRDEPGAEIIQTVQAARPMDFFSDLKFTPPIYLPRPVPHFTGRQADFQAVLEALQGRGPVSITGLMGMGGIGKTSLAIATAHHCRDVSLFPDGICWHTLADKDLESSLEALGAEFGMYWLKNIEDFQQRKTAFRQVLFGRRVLFILDDANYPHRLPDILDLLAGHPVLITSRANLSGLGRSITVERLDRDNARRLFIKTLDRTDMDDARADRALAALESADKTALLNICEDFLGGLPLAISIAASLSAFRGWNIFSLERQLRQKRLDLLKDPHRVTAKDPKDRDVRLSFSLSYDLLPAHAWLVFDVTGVFSADSFSIQALTEAADLSAQDTEAAVDDLAALSLLKRADAQRLTLHPLTREYAIEKLAERGEHAPWERMVQHYVKLVKEDPKTLAYDWRNALHAVDWSFKHQKFEDGLFLMEKVDQYLFETGQWSVRETWLATAIEMAGVFESPRYIYQFNKQRTDQWLRQGHYRKALNAWQELRVLCTCFELLHEQIGWCDYKLASSYRKINQRDKAIALDQANLRQALRAKNWWYIGAVLKNLGNYFQHHGWLDKAFGCYGANLDIKIGIKSSENIPFAHDDLFDCFHARGRYPEARQALRDMRAALDAHPHQESETAFHENRFWLAMSERDFNTAEQALAACHDIAASLGVLHKMADAVYYRGWLSQAQNQYAEAKQHLIRALDLYRTHGFEDEQGKCLRRLGVIHILEGDFRQARTCLDQARENIEKYHGPSERSRWEAAYALLQAHSGYSRDAVRGIRRALNTFAALDIGDIGEERELAEQIKSLSGADWQRAEEELRRDGLEGETLDLPENFLDPEPKVIISPVDQREMVLVSSGPVKSEHYDYPFFLYPFYMDRYPVSNRDYQACLDAMDLPAPPHWPNGRIPAGLENHPVVGITQDEAQGYAEWCGKTLPLAEEWEVAAGIREGCMYPQGEEWDEEKELARCEALEVQGFRRLKREYFTKRKSVFWWSQVYLPPHDTSVDELQFLLLLMGSISLSIEEKKKIIENFAELSQYQVDELIHIFREEEEKFARLETKHFDQLDALQEQHVQAWLGWETENFLFHQEKPITAAIPRQSGESIVFLSRQIRQWSNSPLQAEDENTNFFLWGGGRLAPDKDAFLIHHSTALDPCHRYSDLGFRCVKPVFSREELDKFLNCQGMDVAQAGEQAEWFTRRAQALLRKPKRSRADTDQGLAFCRKALHLSPAHHRALEFFISFLNTAEKSLADLTKEVEEAGVMPGPDAEVRTLFREVQDREQAILAASKEKFPQAFEAGMDFLNRLLNALERSCSLPNLRLSTRDTKESRDYIVNLHRENFPFAMFGRMLMAFAAKERWFTLHTERKSKQ